MTDDFIGVPREDFRDLADEVKTLSHVLAVVAIVLTLLIWALVTKGAIRLTDLFTLPVPGV